MRRERQHLIVDADDTLWENNIYFEHAFDDFCQFLSHSSMTAAEIRSALDEIELINIQTRGYGAANFGRNLVECYERLVERDIAPGDAAAITRLAERILEQPVETIPGVRETLQYLAGRHELTLFTKGHPEEQRLKIDRSGLAPLFHYTAIVREKDSAAYVRLAEEQKMEVDRAWMVGNSPKSDITPALDAGLNAVYVPHDRTWHLERTEFQMSHPRLLVLQRFSDLKEHF